MKGEKAGLVSVILWNGNNLEKSDVLLFFRHRTLKTEEAAHTFGHAARPQAVSRQEMPYIKFLA